MTGPPTAPDLLDRALTVGPVLTAATDCALLRLDGVGSVLATAAGLVGTPAPGRADADLAALTDPALACTWIYRGTVPVRAAAVARDGAAVLLAGAGSVGKSTVAAALVATGWDLLCDAVAPLRVSGREAHAQVLPTSSTVALWPHARTALGLPDNAGTPVRPGISVRSVPADDLRPGAGSPPAAEQGTRVAALVLLGGAAGAGPATEALQGFTSMNLLTGTVWHPDVCSAVLGRAAHFQACTAVADGATVVRVVPDANEHPTVTASRVETLVAALELGRGSAE